MKPRDIIVIGASAGGLSARDALRCTVEQSTLSRHLTEHALRSDDQETIGQWESENRKAEQRSHLIPQVLNHEAK